MDSRRDVVLLFLRDYIQNQGYPPSYREIAEGTGLNATSSVSRSLHQLQSEGFIDFKPGFPRTLRLLDSDPLRTLFRILDATADEEASIDI